MKIAAVTMVYNEPDFLPLWVKYYGAQIGAQNCYVIDHGSDDGSAEHYPGVFFIRLPRSPHDDVKRAALVSNIVGFLLSTYDVVLHTDVDEIAFPDPRIYKSLADYCEHERSDVITAHGFEILHMRGSEPDIRIDRPVLQQRRWVRFTSAMCKPVMVRKPVTWAPGFHCATEPVRFGDLFLFHLRWFDFEIALRRLARTRAQAWADPHAGSWQRLGDDEYRHAFQHFEDIPRHDELAFSIEAPPLRDVIDRVLASQIGREHELYRIDLGVITDVVLSLPDMFKSIF